MTVAALVDELAQMDVQLSIDDGRLAVNGPEGTITDDILSRLRRDKVGIIKYLAERSGHSDADEFPQYAAALQLGRLVLCRRCQHYDGPFEKQLGWCRYHKTEAAPDVVSTCRQFEQCS